MGLINARPRFALDDETGNLYDYMTGKYLKPEGIVDGFDLALVAQLIAQGQHIDLAIVELAPQAAVIAAVTPAVDPAPDAPVEAAPEQANG
jgi:hypothetical protein